MNEQAAEQALRTARLLDAAHSRVALTLKKVLGFSAQAYFLMESIAADSSLSGYEHARRLGRARLPNPDHSLQRLLDLGLAERSREKAADARCVYYQITPEGRAWLKKMRPEIRKAAVAALQSEEVGALREVLFS